MSRVNGTGFQASTANRAFQNNRILEHGIVFFEEFQNSKTQRRVED
jgi:hypothetical protein